MIDPRLEQVREVHKLRVWGNSWAETAKVLGVSIPTAKKRLDEYHERRAAGTLFEDVEDMQERDLYAHPSLMPRNATT